MPKTVEQDDRTKVIDLSKCNVITLPLLDLGPSGRVLEMAVLFFPRKTSNHRWNTVLKLKEHARTAINADDETIVTISERDCGDPGCGGARTIVLIMHPRRPTEAESTSRSSRSLRRTFPMRLRHWPHESACLRPPSKPK
jgi:hypothetical protein